MDRLVQELHLLEEHIKGAYFLCPRSFVKHHQFTVEPHIVMKEWRSKREEPKQIEIKVMQTAVGRSMAQKFSKGMEEPFRTEQLKQTIIHHEQ